MVALHGGLTPRENISALSRDKARIWQDSGSNLERGKGANKRCWDSKRKDARTMLCASNLERGKGASRRRWTASVRTQTSVLHARHVTIRSRRKWDLVTSNSSLQLSLMIK